MRGIFSMQYPLPLPVIGPNPLGPVPSNPGITASSSEAASLLADETTRERVSKSMEEEKKEVSFGLVLSLSLPFGTHILFCAVCTVPYSGCDLLVNLILPTVVFCLNPIESGCIRLDIEEWGAVQDVHIFNV